MICLVHERHQDGRTNFRLMVNAKRIAAVVQQHAN